MSTSKTVTITAVNDDVDNAGDERTGIITHKYKKTFNEDSDERRDKNGWAECYGYHNKRRRYKGHNYVKAHLNRSMRRAEKTLTI